MVPVPGPGPAKPPARPGTGAARRPPGVTGWMETDMAATVPRRHAFIHERGLASGRPALYPRKKSRIRMTSATMASAITALTARPFT